MDRQKGRESLHSQGMFVVVLSIAIVSLRQSRSMVWLSKVGYGGDDGVLRIWRAIDHSARVCLLPHSA